MPGRTLAIGDIHGCASELAALLAAITPTAEDTVVTLGDYVDRGPDSRGVIDQLLELAQRCRLVALRGNHEVMFLEALDALPRGQYWQAHWGVETLASYGGSLGDVSESHQEFLRNTRPHHETADHFFIHAGYHFETPLAEQTDPYRYWHRLPEYGGYPPHRCGKRAIVGHTPQITCQPLNLGHLVCIDTGCFAFGWLTALDVGTNEWWQANKLGEIRAGVLHSP